MTVNIGTQGARISAGQSTDLDTQLQMEKVPEAEAILAKIAEGIF